MVRALTASVAALGLALGGADAADAAPGDRDPTWDGDGKRSDPSGGMVSDFVATSGTRVLVAGRNSASVRVVRYRSDGSRDPDFASNGSISVALGSSYFLADLVALRSGAVLLVGRVDSELGLVRITPAGTLDPNFGTGGIVRHAGFSAIFPREVVEAPDGKILIATRGEESGGSGCPRLGVRRFLATGEVDTIFGEGGVARGGTCPAGRISETRALALAPDGKILVAGDVTETGFSRTSDPARVERFTAKGVLDTSFGTNGRVDPAVSNVAGLGVSGTGAIFVGGWTRIGGGNNTQSFGVIAGLSPSGGVAGGFGTNGVAKVRIPDKIIFDAFISTGFTRFARAPGGNLFGAGNTFSGAPTLVARFRPDGNLDSSWGPAEATPDMLGSPAHVARDDDLPRLTDMALQPDGKLVLTGAPRTGNETATFLTVRLFSECEVFAACTGSVVVSGDGSTATLLTNLTSASSVGILVQRVVGKRRVRVGRVPLGRRSRGRRAIRWNLKVNGHRLSPGRYELIFRAFDRRGRIIDLSKPFRLRVRA